LVNLEKTLDFASVRQQLPQIGTIVFANDLLATAYALSILPSSSLVSLTPQPPPFMVDRDSASAPSLSAHFPIALLAPGTGLGQSLLLSTGFISQTQPAGTLSANNPPPTDDTPLTDNTLIALSSEGAHTDFAPRTEQEVRLWRFLQRRFGHVSYERVLSGPGLSNLYSFLAQENPSDAIPAPLDGQRPSPPEITSRALAGTCPLCQASLNLFVDILGAQAGNLALQTMATGGVCLAGGIVSHILPALRQERFRQAFLDKGRFRKVLAQIPIAAVRNDQAALWGAARLAYLATV
jgi:glucokinase